MSDPYRSVVDYDREEARYARYSAEREGDDYDPLDDRPSRAELENEAAEDREWRRRHGGGQ